MSPAIWQEENCAGAAIITCVLKATSQGTTERPPESADVIIGKIQSSLLGVTQSANQIRIHEELSRAAGVRLDRAGASLLHKLRLYADQPFRVTSLAAVLAVDTPTVTRKVQQLERLGYVERDADPVDGRASLIRLTQSGQDTVDRFLVAHRNRLSRLFHDWDENDMHHFAALLEKFAESISKDSESVHDD